jgi:hypothetical protein
MAKDTDKQTLWQKLEENFSHKSMMEILGVDRDENSHSKFLGWLFENKDTREVAIKSLLSLLKDKHENDKEQKVTHFPVSLSEFEEKSFGIKDVKVTLEDFVEAYGRNERGNKITDKNGNEIKYYGRADVVIEVNCEINNEKKSLYIIIENKIDSFEHKMGIGQKFEDAPGAQWQTEGYYQYYKKKFGKEDCVFVFLTRPKSQINIPDKIKSQYNKERVDGRAQCDSFIWIDYQNVLDNILYNTLSFLNKKERLETELRIKDYISCLGISKTQDNLMAISSDSELAKLSDDIWNSIQKDKGESLKTNQDLIRPLFEVLFHNHKDNEIIKSIYEIVKGKDYTTYSIEGIESGLTKNGLIKRVIELYLNNKGDKDIKEDFPPTLRMACKGSQAKEESLSNQVVIKLNEYIQKKNEYKKSKNQEQLNKESAHKAINIDNDWKELYHGDIFSGWYVIQTGWDGRILMNNFIKHVKHIMPEYTIKECVEEKKLKDIMSLLANP